VPSEIHKTKEDLSIAVAGGLRPLSNYVDPVQFYFDAFQRDIEADKANPLHLEFAL
jgi:hypothetical protein